ncbi:MAG: 50S ribosomal protein L1 [Rhodothermaceae bacterium]|nr:50S ribosomal protein L1 [Bacteroidota bacterium]MXW13763.1 50S ribosomal protein L1 [Rhodothermaceae bacterium]MDE2646234.1 50S ribosomal protein L1 [Bacteroidota bacterium]MXW31988.1 50S ribosomal protein L1 [Rhodothermaceae bacterium]MXX97451.1 50S ribosomal protein L1 [Rhodothermaceae bacterium]
MARKGKRYQNASKVIQEAGGGPFTLQEAADVLKSIKTAKFDESVDLDLRLGVDPRHADQMVRGSVALPHGTGKEIRVLVLASPDKQEEATSAGADHVGLDDYVKRIQEGWTDIDVVIATPNVMSKIGRLGRVLGPRGLMPNPKSGTVTMDVAGAVKAVKAGKIDFRVDKQGNLHTGIGRVSFSATQIEENARAFLMEVLRLRPASAKGAYVRSITLSTSMGPAVEISCAEAINVAR